MGNGGVGGSATDPALVRPSPAVDPFDPTSSVRRRRGRLVALGAAATVVLLVLVVPSLVPAVGFGIVTHESCGLGRVEASGYFWTPTILVNSPYLGSAWANWTEPGSLTSINVSGGQSAGIFELVEWNLSSARNISTLGPGLNQPCDRSLVPTAAATRDEIGYNLAHPLNWSDVNETQNFTYVVDGLGLGSGYDAPSVRFGNAFDPSSVRLNISTCGGGPSESDASSTEYPVEIPFAMNGHTLWVGGQFPASVRYSYRFPANGVWHISNPTPGVSDVFDDGWAFDFRACGLP